MRTLMILLLALPASAGGWQTTFEADLAEALDVQGRRVIVVAPDGGFEGVDAARALRASLKAKVSALLDERALGSQYEDDDAFLKATRGLPVDRWVSVRVFPSEGGALVVVTAYDKAGEATALSGTEGVAIGTGAGAGEPRANVVDSVGQVVGEKREAREDKLEDYAKRFLWIGSKVGANQYGAWTYDVVYQGKYKRSVSNRELYGLIDDEHIDQRVQRKQNDLMAATWGLLALTAVTAAITVGTVTLGAADANTAAQQRKAPNADPAREVELRKRELDGTMLACGGATIGGTCLAAYGWTPCLTLAWAKNDNIAVLKPEELREHIDVYNKGLAKKLGLEGADLPTGLSSPFAQAY